MQPILWGRSDILFSSSAGDSKTSGLSRKQQRPEVFLEASRSVFPAEDLHRWRLQHRGHRGWHTGTSDQPPFPGSTTICVTMNDHGIRTVYWQALQSSQGLRHKTLLIHCTQLHWDSALCKTNMILETTLK